MQNKKQKQEAEYRAPQYAVRCHSPAINGDSGQRDIVAVHARVLFRDVCHIRISAGAQFRFIVTEFVKQHPGSGFSDNRDIISAVYLTGGISGGVHRARLDSRHSAY